MDTSKFFNRKSSIRNPKVPYKKGKSIEESSNYKSRIFSRVKETKTVKTLLNIRTSIFRIENLLKANSNLENKSSKVQQKYKLIEIQEEKNKKKKSKKSKSSGLGNIIQRPKTGAMDWIKNFVTYTFLGWLFTTLQPLISKLEVLGPILQGAFDFLGGTVKFLLNGFASFVKFGYDTKDFITKKSDEIKQQAQGLKENFDNTLAELKNVVDGTVDAVASYLEIVDKDVLAQAQQQSGRDSGSGIPPLPPVPSTDTSTYKPTIPTPQFGPVKGISTGGVIGYAEGGRIDPRSPVTRGVPQEDEQKKKLLFPPQTTQSTKTSPGADVGGEQYIKKLYKENDSPLSHFEIIFGRNDKSSVYSALLKSSEEYKKPISKPLGDLGLPQLMGAINDASLGQKPAEKTYENLATGLQYMVDYSRNDPERFDKIDLKQMLKSIIEPKIDKTLDLIRQQININTRETPSGGGGGDGSPTGGGGGTSGGYYGGYSPQTGLQKEIYEYLINEKGLSDVQALGLLANINRESSFNPGVLITDINGKPSGGLFQWNGGRFEMMTKNIPNWKNNWKGQVDWALDEPWIEGRNGKAYKAKSFSSAQEAADWWMTEWEVVRYPERDSKKHSDYLKTIPRAPDGSAKFRGPETPSQFTGGILPSTKLGSRAGMRLHPLTGEYKMHKGNDYPMDIGTPITVLKGGVVTRSEVNGSLTSGYGNLIEIRHPDGSVSAYAHLDKRKVKVGDNIRPGTVIGTVGNTGGSSGPHLHFEYDGPDGKPVTNANTLNSFADNNFRFGDDVKPSQVEKLAMKDGKEGVIEDGVWKKKEWTKEEKDRYNQINRSQQQDRLKPSAPQLKDLKSVQNKIRDMKPGDPPLVIPGVGKVIIKKNEKGTVIKEYYDSNNKLIGSDKFFNLVKNPSQQKQSPPQQRKTPRGRSGASRQTSQASQRSEVKTYNSQTYFKSGNKYYEEIPGRGVFEIPKEIYDMVPVKKKYGGLVYKPGTTPVLPEQKYASYNDPFNNGIIAIQPIYIQQPVPVPVGGGSGGMIAFSTPKVNNMDNYQQLMRE